MCSREFLESPEYPPISVVDPDFPRGGHVKILERKPIIWQGFCRNCMKMKEIGPGGGGNAFVANFTAKPLNPSNRATRYRTTDKRTLTVCVASLKSPSSLSATATWCGMMVQCRESGNCCRSGFQPASSYLLLN